MGKQLGKIGLRKCYVCKEILPLNFDYFYRDSRKWYMWYDHRCRGCNIKRNRDNKFWQKRKIDNWYEWYVYIIKCEKYYKIWSTKNKVMKKRMETLQTWNPYTIYLVRQLYTTDRFKTESELHHKFKHNHIRGERFKLSKEDIESIV